MSVPALIRESGVNDAAWRRTVRDLVNLITRRTLGYGPTSERPANPDTGTAFYDVTLGKPVWWSGTAWKDATGATA